MWRSARWAALAFRLTPNLVVQKLICVFSLAGLFWSSTMPYPGSRAIRPPRTALPAFPSTLWCSRSCTTPSWTCSNQEAGPSASALLQPWPRSQLQSTDARPFPEHSLQPCTVTPSEQALALSAVFVPQWLLDVFHEDLEISLRSDLSQCVMCAARSHQEEGNRRDTVLLHKRLRSASVSVRLSSPLDAIF